MSFWERVKKEHFFFPACVLSRPRLGVEATPRGILGELIVSGYKSTRDTSVRLIVRRERLCQAVGERKTTDPVMGK